MQIEEYNSAFKTGRQAGQEDVALEILKHQPAEAHRIAQAFLEQYGYTADKR